MRTNNGLTLQFSTLHYASRGGTVSNRTLCALMSVSYHGGFRVTINKRVTVNEWKWEEERERSNGTVVCKPSRYRPLVMAVLCFKTRCGGAATFCRVEVNPSPGFNNNAILIEVEHIKSSVVSLWSFHGCEITISPDCHVP